MILGRMRRLRNREVVASQELSRDGSPAERYGLATRFGENGTSFLGLYEGWEHFHAPSQEGFVAFEQHGSAALALGDPVCAPEVEPAIRSSFAQYCRSRGLTPAFVATTANFAARACHEGWSAVKIGEEPVFDTEAYAPRGNRTKKVRSAANQARKAGVILEVLPPGGRPSLALAQEMEEVVGLWRDSRNVKALGFALRLAPLTFARDKVIIVAHSGGRLEGFVTCVPYRGGEAFYVEDLIRRPDATNGVTELLFLRAVDECKTRGATAVNLGLAPLRNCRKQPGGRRVLGGALDFAFRRLNGFYSFKSLEHFKAKFAPARWEEVYLVYPPGNLAKVSLSLLLAFTPGRFGLAAAAASRFRPRRSPRRRVLAPGTILGGLAIAAAALGVRDPDLALDLARQVFGFAEAPLFAAEGVARGHMLIDAITLAAGGAWFVRANRRQD